MLTDYRLLVIHVVVLTNYMLLYRSTAKHHNKIIMKWKWLINRTNKTYSWFFYWSGSVIRRKTVANDMALFYVNLT